MRTFEIEVCEKPLEHVTCVCVCFSRVADTLDMLQMIPFRACV